MKPIICCGLTPCIQRMLEFPELEKGAVNRAARVTTGIGGKGANTAQMVLQLGGNPLLVGFVGGENGRLLEKMLDAEEIGYRHVVVESETRVCQTLVEAGNPEVTELVEEMPSQSPDNWEHMLKLFQSLELADAVVSISGRLPTGAPAYAYARICELVHERGGHVILDTPGEPLLLALEHEPAMIKINEDELLATIGGDDLLQACGTLRNLGACSVLITRGSRPAFYMDEVRMLDIVPPKIEAVNPIGSGDAVTAGLAVELALGKGVEEALITGIACGAANALHIVSGKLNPDEVELLKKRVKIVKC